MSLRVSEKIIPGPLLSNGTRYRAMLATQRPGTTDRDKYPLYQFELIECGISPLFQDSIIDERNITKLDRGTAKSFARRCDFETQSLTANGFTEVTDEAIKSKVFGRSVRGLDYKKIAAAEVPARHADLTGPTAPLPGRNGMNGTVLIKGAAL